MELPDKFDYTNIEHLQLVQNQVEQFKLALGNLQRIDGFIALYAAATAGGCVLGYVVPLTTPVIIGAAYMVGCYRTERTAYSQQYGEALSNLIDIYKWSMGKDTGNHWYKLGVPTLQNLILNLGPWVPKEIIHTWTDADFNSSLIYKRIEPDATFKKQLRDFEAGLPSVQHLYRLYGQNGGVKDILAPLQEKAQEMKERALAQLPNLYSPLKSE